MKADCLATSQDYISEEGRKAARLTLLPPGTILMVVRGMILARRFPVAITAVQATINQDLRALVPSTLVDPMFVLRALQVISNDVVHATGEATHGTRRLDSDMLKAWPIALPPLAEQRRIIGAIERLLEKVASARERLERVPLTLKRFRQAVLAAACSGQLSVLWRASNPEEKSTEENLRCSGTEIEEQDRFEHPDTWRLVPAADVFDWTSGKNLPEKLSRPGVYPVYGGNGISGCHDSYLAQPLTIVVGRVGALCGNVYLTETRAWITDNAIYAKAQSTSLYAPFARLVFERAELNSRSGGSGQPFVNQTVLNSVGVPLPPIGEQEHIVSRTSTLLAIADTIEQRAKSALQRVERLTQSILAKAFRGELVPTEAELARREGRGYETAGELLDRLKRAADDAPKLSRGRKSTKGPTPSEGRLPGFTEG